MGSKIMMMLKLMGSAGPRANARASCMGEHMSVNYSTSQYITVNYTNHIIMPTWVISGSNLGQQALCFSKEGPG